MGASIFIMSEIIGVPYIYLMLYALIPAFLYYFSLSTSVYFESSRINLKRLDDSEIPNVREEILKGGYLLIPVAVLLASIMSGETPGRAGFKAVVSLIVMVDLVRSLRWIRSRWALPGVAAAGGLALMALFLAYGPVSAPGALLAKVDVPLLGPVPWIRLVLFGAGVLFAVLPSLRGLPIVLLIGLSIARWEFPSELLWMGKLPYIGILLPIAFGAAGLFLIAAPIFSEHEEVPADESARELGRAVLIGLENGAKNSLGLVAATSSIGLIVGLLVLAALGVRISILVTEVASTSLFMAFFLVMVASLVMGMGLPTIAAYLLLVIVVAPSVTELGAPLIAAHMFIFYFGVISSLTPPVALAAYAASGISGANAMRTGLTACRLAITAFIVPYLFVYHPELLLIEGTCLGDRLPPGRQLRRDFSRLDGGDGLRIRAPRRRFANRFARCGPSALPGPGVAERGGAEYSGPRMFSIKYRGAGSRWCLRSLPANRPANEKYNFPGRINFPEG